MATTTSSTFESGQSSSVSNSIDVKSLAVDGHDSFNSLPAQLHHQQTVRPTNQQQTSTTNNLTEEEVSHLFSVMQRAKQFDEEERAMQNKLIQGQLSKYTNVVKGWQYRWFVIDPNLGTLEYYMLEEREKERHPRGRVFLAGCQIIPSEEDSQTFTLNAASVTYKLKANDAKSRQFWVNNLRLVAQNVEAKNGAVLNGNSASSVPVNTQLTTDISESFDIVRNQLITTRNQVTSFTEMIEGITNTDADLLLIKATTQAAVQTIEQCFTILESISK